MRFPRNNQSQLDETSLRPLSSVCAGERVKIARIRTDCPSLASRLTAMGLMVDVEITVVNNSHPGPFVVSVKGTKVMLGLGMADKIMVVCPGPDTT